MALLFHIWYYVSLVTMIVVVLTATKTIRVWHIIMAIICLPGTIVLFVGFLALCIPLVIIALVGKYGKKYGRSAWRILTKTVYTFKH